MKFLRKAAALFVSAIMMLSAIPLTASAWEDEMPEAESGKEYSFTLPDEKIYWNEYRPDLFYYDSVAYTVTLEQSGYLVLDISCAAGQADFSVSEGTNKPTKIKNYYAWVYTGSQEKKNDNDDYSTNINLYWDGTAKKFTGKISYYLGKGTYRIRFGRSEYEEVYGTGKVTFTPYFYASDSIFGNAKTAHDGKKYKSSLTVVGDEKVYKFNVAEPSSMKIDISQEDAKRSGLNMTLYKESEDEVVEVDSVETEDSNNFNNLDDYVAFYNDASGTVYYEVDEGTYYLVITQTQGEYDNTKPTVTMTAEFPDASTDDDDGDSSDDGESYFLDLNLKKGNTTTLKKFIETDSEITWSSSDTAVATVSSNGKVRAKAKGTAVITAEFEDTSEKIKINVK